MFSLMLNMCIDFFFFFFQAEDGIRDVAVTGVQTCALPICLDILAKRIQKVRLVKFVIPQNAARGILKDLATCGIVETSVFPDLEGLSRELETKWQQLDLGKQKSLKRIEEKTRTKRREQNK